MLEKYAQSCFGEFRTKMSADTPSGGEYPRVLFIEMCQETLKPREAARYVIEFAGLKFCQFEPDQTMSLSLTNLIGGAEYSAVFF
jgi:hypothetical protein